MTGFSDFLEDKFINVALRNTAYTGPATVYASLHSTDPLDTGLGTGTITSRVSAAFSAPSGGVTSNSGTVSFTSVTGATYTHVALWDASSSGNMLYSGSLTSSVTAATGDTVSFSATTLTVTHT